ncbi:rhodanese-like domain-containing protein [Bacteroidota bacterium]
MNIRIILSIVLISFGFIAAMIPVKQTSSVRLNADQLLRETKLETYKISVDDLADGLINQDPSIQLIDVRSPEAYKEYHLPGAVNIPIDSLFDEDWLPYVDQIARRNIFYCNGSTWSNQAWILTKQMGIDNNFVLGGGLNEWFGTIIDPEEPSVDAPSEAWDLYHSRLAAKQYFTGAKAVAPMKDIIKAPIPRRQKKRVQGGCS